VDKAKYIFIPGKIKISPMEKRVVMVSRLFLNLISFSGEVMD
jgi:hypothetical protein